MGLRTVPLVIYTCTEYITLRTAAVFLNFQYSCHIQPGERALRLHGLDHTTNDTKLVIINPTFLYL